MKKQPGTSHRVGNCVVCDKQLEEWVDLTKLVDFFKFCEKHQKEIEAMTMQTEFPKSENKFIKATIFQDQDIPLTFRGWEKKGNEDREYKGQVKSWKQNLKYCLRYSYPEFAIDEAGEKILGKDGKPFQNRNYDSNFPHGYTILYHFEEGQLDSGSLPLFNAFCLVRPNAGDLLMISRTGIDKETKWKVRKANHASASVSENQQTATDFDGVDEAPF